MSSSISHGPLGSFLLSPYFPTPISRLTVLPSMILLNDWLRVLTEMALDLFAAQKRVAGQG